MSMLDDMTSPVLDTAVSDSSDSLKVTIGPLKLGVLGSPNPDDGQPNPQLIEWHRANEVPDKACVGGSPMTQCTIPQGLYYLTVKFNTLNESVLRQVDLMDAGPYKVKTFYRSLCMYLIDTKVSQSSGSKDPKQQVTLQLKQAKDKPGESV